MSDPAAPTPASLPTYRPLFGRYDELADERGHPREHWEQLVRLFERLGPTEVDDRRRMADRLLVGEGASYTNDESDEAAHTWHIDPVPLLWTRAEWTALEAGLAQRARLLDAIVGDLYGPQRLLVEGVVPAELVAGSPRFRWPVAGPANAGPSPATPRLATYAADVVRDGQGHLVVLRDHTDTPTGAGYALVNRRVLSRLFADTYRDARVERLAGFFAQLRTTLAGLAPADRRNPRTVVLTPGVGHASYFEHTYLASYLGYHLVEGADLAVRGGRVWLRALAGLEPVDVVLRRIDDGDTDPLELGSNGSAGGRTGVPGLLEAAREGGVGVANAIGSGIAGAVALQAYLPAACELLLGERLRLPSLPTLWLGDPDHRAEATARFDDLVLHDTAGGGVRSVFAGRLGEREREEWLAAIAAQPGRFVAQPKVVMGTAPVLRDQQVVPGVVVVRTQLVAGAEGWVALPGGLGRVVDEETPVLTQPGGTAKDVWVPAEERRGAERGWSAVAPPVPQIDLRSSTPSRVAEAMFWVGRNAERAEATTRLALALLTRSEQSPELAELAGGAWIERTTAGLRAISGAPDVGPQEVGGTASVAEPTARIRLELAGALGDRPGALADSVGHLAESAGSVREYLSTGTWRVVTNLDARRLGLAADAAKADLIVVAESLNDTVLSLMALAGLAAESIVRGPAWRFLDLGRRLERALLLLGLVEAMLVPATDPAVVQPVYETLLTSCESLFAYRRRYRSDLELDPLCELLLADDTNPRSLAFQLDRMVEDLASLPERRDHRQTRERVDDTSRLVIQAAWEEGHRAGPAAPHLGLHQFVLDARGALLGLSGSLVSTWFAHVGEAHIVRRSDP